MYIYIKYLLFYVENFIQLYTSTITLKDPAIEQFYVKNGQLYLKWSKDEIQITKYNIILYTDNCTNNNTIEVVDACGTTLTIAIENLTKIDNFYLQIQACSNSICSRNGTALYISDIEDPGKYVNAFFCIIDLFSTALQLSRVTINVNDSFVCFNTSIRDKCGKFGTVKINNKEYVLNNSVHFMNRTSYYAYPFDNSWMEYRLSIITSNINVELCITNISNFLSEFMSEWKFIIYDQCSKSKKPCSAINTSLKYLEIGFQRIVNIKGEYSV